MSEIIELLALPIQVAVTVCAIALSLSLGLYFKNRLVRDFEGFQNKLTQWSALMHTHMTQTQASLAQHSEDLGKASRAINGDMLRIKESVFNLKQDLLEKINGLELTTEKFDEKFGRIVELKSEFNTLIGKVTQVESDYRGLRVENEQHGVRMSAVGKILKSHAEDLSRLKKGKT